MLSCLCIAAALGLSASTHGYLALVAGILAATVGVPIPEEVPLLTAGVLAAMGVIELKWAILFGAMACFVGDIAVYSVGRRIGSHLSEHPYLRRLVKGRYLLKARHLYVRRGPWTLSVARLVPGLKMPFLFTAGALRMPWRRFLFFDLLSVAVLVPAVISLAFHSSRSLPQLRAIVREAGLVGVGIFIVIAAGATAAYLLRRRRRQLMALEAITKPVKVKRRKRSRRKRH